MPPPYLLTGIDDAFAMLPPKLHNNADGFFFDRNDQGHIRLNFGAFGLATLKAHHRASAAIAQSGMNLVLDEVVLSNELMEDWRATLRWADVFWVGVHCDLAELERREVARGDRVHGQARGQFDLVHRYLDYDFEVDTSNTAAAKCATRSINALTAK